MDCGSVFLAALHKDLFSKFFCAQIEGHRVRQPQFFSQPIPPAASVTPSAFLALFGMPISVAQMR